MDVDRRRGFTRGTSVLVFALASLVTASGRAESLDQALLRRAPALLGDLRAHGTKSVGVLKFEVDRGGRPVGPLGLGLAGRLELALILASDARDPLAILHDADAVAASTPGADHRSLAGRRLLFDASYPMAWGDRSVRADAFLTGKVAVGADPKVLRVRIEVVDREGSSPRPIASFEADADAPTLAESGSSFLLRGAFDDGNFDLSDAPPTTTPITARRPKPTSSPTPTSTPVSLSQARPTPSPNPLDDPRAPVALEIRYDGRPVLPEFRDGQAWLIEPREGQRVEFALRKRTPDDARFGVLLMVNGYNTLGKEKRPPAQSRKWIVGPQPDPIVIRGYQADGVQAEAFQVLSSDESRKHESRYGPDAGTIQLIVFREARGEPAPMSLDDATLALARMSHGYPGGPRPRDLSALKHRLDAGSAARGMIEGGELIGVKVQAVRFALDPSPVMAATITYYRRPALSDGRSLP